MKKTYKLLLALVMCMGLAVTAYAYFPETVEEATTQIKLDIEADNNPDTDLDIVVEEPFYTVEWDYENEREYLVEQTHYNIVGGESTFTATNLNPDDDSYMTIFLYSYYYDDFNDGYYESRGAGLCSHGDVNAWIYQDAWWDRAPDMQEVQIGSGESYTFNLPLEDGEMIMLYLQQYYPEEDYYYWRGWFIKRDDAALSALIASQKPEADPVPESGTAYTRTQTVLVDDKQVTLEAYAIKDENGDETNYVKVRDLADVLNGTAAQFGVGWDGAVNLISKTAYEPTGQEHNTPYSGDMPFTKTTYETKIDGVVSELKAFTITDATGGGNTYYKLRDLGEALGFDVSWSAEKGIYIETDQPYTAD